MVGVRGAATAALRRYGDLVRVGVAKLGKHSSKVTRRAVMALACIDLLDFNNAGWMTSYCVDHVDAIATVTNEGSLDYLRHLLFLRQACWRGANAPKRRHVS